MRGKKVINNNQVLLNANHKIEHNRNHLKSRVNEVKSLELKLKSQTSLPQTQKFIKLPVQNTVNDYEFERKQRQTQHCIPSKGTNNLAFIVQAPIEVARLQRNTEGVTSIKPRQNYFLNSQQDSSNHNSLQKIKLVSADSKEKSLSRSENNSAKKRGIQLTKTLLKRISGMYNDKDFQNRTSFINKSNKDETTGMTMTMSGRGVCDEYQISDFDFQIPPNHTFNISSSNPLSFNDSGNWNRNSGYCNNSANSISWNKQSAELARTDKKQENSKQNPQSSQSREKLTLRTPQKQLMKVRSYDLLGTRATADSIVVGQEPPPRPVQSRRGAQALPNESQERQRYLIRSKNKTMDQLSLKASMVVGFDHYYQ